MTERPFNVALSNDEIVALVKYHTSCARRATTAMGKAALQHRGHNLLPSGRYLKQLHDEAAKIVDSHVTRAKGLLSIIKK